MVTTVEPAIYRDGSYGMRTENMTLCIPDISSEYGDFLCFETLTLAPIDLSLIEISLMTSEEIHWLNTYHLTVRERLTPHLNTAQKYWLYEKTREIENEFDNQKY
jgi:Xaa-Pro aminopeptidase